MTPETISLSDRLACARRELRMRHQVYPGLVERGKLLESTAQAEILSMHALVRTCKILIEVAPEIQAITRESRAGRFVGKTRLLALMIRLEAMIGGTQAENMAHAEHD